MLVCETKVPGEMLSEITCFEPLVILTQPWTFLRMTLPSLRARSKNMTDDGYRVTSAPVKRMCGWRGPAGASRRPRRSGRTRRSGDREPAPWSASSPAFRPRCRLDVARACRGWWEQGYFDAASAPRRDEQPTRAKADPGRRAAARAGRRCIERAERAGGQSVDGAQPDRQALGSGLCTSREPPRARRPGRPLSVK